MWIHLFTSVCPKHLRLNAQTALLYQTPTLMYRCMWISAVLTQNNKDMSMFDRKEKREKEREGGRERKARVRVYERRVGETDCAVKGDGKGSM